MIRKTSKTVAILLAILFITLLFKITKVNAMTVEEARENIASLAIEFWNEKRNDCIYDADFDDSVFGSYQFNRANTYNELHPKQTFMQRKYIFDCVGFVTYIVHYATGLNAPGDKTGSSWDGAYGFANPYSARWTPGVQDKAHFREVNSHNEGLLPGDILMTSSSSQPHVAIYVGNGNMVDMEIPGLRYHSMDELSKWKGYSWDFRVARLTSLDGASSPVLADGTAIEPPSGANNNNNNNHNSGLVDLDQLDFTFNGMPTTVKKVSGHSLMYYINKIAEAFDYLFGVILNGFKVVPAGIVDGLEKWITYVIDGLSYNTASNQSEVQIEQKEKNAYTIEDLVFNKIPILDPNVFSNTVGGEEVVTGSAIDKIRTVIATWYVSLRNLAIVVLSLTVIYIGIRMAMATTASAKANYKGMLINWVIALLIVGVIHLIMIVVLDVNNNLVSLISKSATSEKAIYETIRSRTWDLRISVGFPAAVIYVTMFVLYVRFLWVYVKRWFSILMLIALAPLIGVKYAIDGAKSGKRGKALSDWLYDFVMNVLLQSIHAIIYAALMPIAIDLSTKSVIGYIIALVFINFILKADKIFMNIFNFNKSKMATENEEAVDNPKKDFTSVVHTAASTAMAVGMAKDLATTVGSGVKTLGRGVYRFAAKEYDEVHGGNIRSELKQKKNNILNKYDSAVNKVYKAVMDKDSNYRVLSIMSRQKGSTGRAAKKQLRKAKASRKKKYSAPFKFIKSAGGNALKIAFGVPMMVVNPGVGAGMIFNGINGNINMSTQRDDKGNKYKGKEAAAQFMTLGAYGTQKEINKSEKKVDKAVNYLKQANNKEEEIREAFRNTFGEEETKEAKRYKKDMNYILTFAEQNNIHMLLREELNFKGVYKIDNNNVDQVIKDMVEEISKKIGLEEQFTITRAKDIKKEMTTKAKEMYNEVQAFNANTVGQPQPSNTNGSGQQSNSNGQAQQNASNTQTNTNVEPQEFGASHMAKGFAEAIIEKGITISNNTPETVNRYMDLTEKIMDLHNLNNKARKDIKSTVVRESEFIKSLNRKKGSTDSENRFI